MAKKRTENRSNDNGGGAGVHLNPKIGFHLEPDLYAALERWRKSQRPMPDRSESIRQFIREGLHRRGHWEDSEEDE